MLVYSNSIYGGMVNGRKLSLMTDYRRKMEDLYSAIPTQEMNSGALCWRKRMPSMQQYGVIFFCY
jgi:hypothetical protein